MFEPDIDLEWAVGVDREPVFERDRRVRVQTSPEFMLAVGVLLVAILWLYFPGGGWKD